MAAGSGLSGIAFLMYGPYGKLAFFSAHVLPVASEYTVSCLTKASASSV